MKKTEDELREKGYRAIAGVDEVGRGPLAGPVFAAAVVLPRDFDVPGVDDSKKLSEKRRKELYEVIMDRALAVGIGQVSHEIIDEINILQATKKAMMLALEDAERDMIRRAGDSRASGDRPAGPDFVLLDALTLEELTLPQKGIIKGDGNVLCIAAASIIAKVSRDQLMEEYDRLYPGYAFASNKGYGTKVHMEALRRQGPCPIHRKTFLKNMK